MPAMSMFGMRSDSSVKPALYVSQFTSGSRVALWVAGVVAGPAGEAGGSYRVAVPVTAGGVR